MKNLRWLLPLTGMLLAPVAAQAQFLARPPGAYYSRGISISYFGPRLSVSGYFGRSYYGYPAYPYYAPPRVTVFYATPPPIYVGPPIVVNQRIQIAPPAPVVNRAPANPVDDNGDPFLRIEPRRRPQVDDRPRPMPPAVDDRPLPGKEAGKFRPLDPRNRERAGQPAAPDAAPPAAMPKVPEPPPLPDVPLQPQQDPKDELARLLTLGRHALESQQYGLAERRFRQAVKVDAQSAMSHFLLAQARFALGHYNEAVDAIHTGMRLRVEWPLVKFNIRQLYGKNGADFREQQFRLSETLARNPRDARLLFLYGYQLWFDGQQEEARGYFRRAVETAPDRTFINRFLNAMPGQPIARGQ